MRKRRRLQNTADKELGKDDAPKQDVKMKVCISVSVLSEVGSCVCVCIY